MSVKSLSCSSRLLDWVNLIQELEILLIMREERNQTQMNHILLQIYRLML